MLRDASLTGCVVLSSPLAPLPLLITHLPLRTLKEKQSPSVTKITWALFVCVLVRDGVTQGHYLIAENLDLARRSVYELVVARAEVVRVDLDV